MVDLPRKIAAERENVETALANLSQAMDRPEKTVVELAAMGAFLHSIYNGIENILKQALIARDIRIPSSPIWHKELLDTSVSHGVISQMLADELYEYLTFRHFFVHAYGFMLEEDHLRDLAKDIPSVWSSFLSAVERWT